MSYISIEVDIDHGRIVAKEPEKLPLTAKGVLTIFNSGDSSPSPAGKRVKLPLIEGNGKKKINVTTSEIDAALWD
jgi:hypothetical protein